MGAKEGILLGKIALKLGIVSSEQLEECIREQEQATRQGAPVKPLGAILLQKQVIDTTQLDRLVAAQQQALQEEHEWLEARKEDVLFGKLLVKFGILPVEKVTECLRIQAQMHDRDVDVRLGELMSKKGYLTPAQVTDTLRLQQKTIMECVACARAFNVPAYKRKEGFACPKCGGDLQLRARPENINVAGEIEPSRDRKGAAFQESPLEREPSRDRKGAVPALQPATGPDTPTVVGTAEAVTTPNAPGQSFRPAKGTPFGRYLLLEELGRGGMGIVYKAWDTQLKRTVALKMMLEKEADGDPAMIKRFEREAQSVAKLRHPHIVQIYDVGVHEGSHYFTMDFLEGETLKDMLVDFYATRGGGLAARGSSPADPRHGRGRKPLPLRNRLEILRDVALALEHAHAQGVIHRDLKPANIIVTPDRGAVVTDFGLARDIKQAAKSGLTLSGQVMGTPGYMSPEQAEGKVAKIGPHSDVYALGVILYEMATGRLPFVSDNIYELLRKVVQEEPTPPGKIAPRLHRDVETVCLKALEKDPRRRYRSAAEFADDLARYLQGEPIAARPLTTAERLWRKAVRYRMLVIPTAAAILLGLALGVYALAGSMKKARDIDRALTKAAQAESLAKEAQARFSLTRGDSGVCSIYDEDTEKQCAAARDAFREALTLDPESADAKSGFERVDARLRELAGARDLAARNAEQAKKDAQTEAAAALLALDKAGRVQEILARWIIVVEPLRKMEAVFYDSTMSLEDKRKVCAEHWPAVETFINKTPPDDTSQSTMLAFSGWARRLAGYKEEGLQRMRKARQLDSDLPYGALTEALAHFSVYLARQALPQIIMGAGDITLDNTPPAETAEMRKTRMEMERLLNEAAAARVWGKGMAEDFRTAIGGLQAMQAGRYEEAEKALSAVVGTGAMSLFLTDIYLARAKLCYLCKRFKEGLAHLANVVRVRPMQAELYDYVGLLKYAEAAEIASRGADPRPLLTESISDFEAALKRNPECAEAYNNRGAVYMSLGEAEAARGADPRATYEKAISDFEAALKRNPEDANAYNNRGTAYARLGEAEAARGADPRATYEKAISDFGAALKRNPEYANAYNNRGTAYARLGEAEAARGADPKPSYEKALDDYATALKMNPSLWQARANRGIVFENLGRYAEAVAEYEAALKLVGDNYPPLKECLARAKAKAGK